MSRWAWFAPLLLATGVVLAQNAPEAGPDSSATAAEAQKEQAQKDAAQKTKEDAKLLDGMSILGNQEAPKALVIVPWKTSELGGSVGISPMLDDSRQPVDKEVFLRELSYYEIRSAGPDTAAAESHASQPITAARRSKS